MIIVARTGPGKKYHRWRKIQWYDAWHDAYEPLCGMAFEGWSLVNLDMSASLTLTCNNCKRILGNKRNP